MDNVVIVVMKKTTRVSGVCPSDTTYTHHFCRHLEFPDSLDSLIKGGPRRKSVWLVFKNDETCVSKPRDSP